MNLSALKRFGIHQRHTFLLAQVKIVMAVLYYLTRKVTRMEFSSSNVMAFIICFCQAEENSIHVNKKKAQNLLYCCYGAVLAETNERLTDEHPKAWPDGPVFLRACSDIEKGKLTADMAMEFENQCPSDILDLIKKTIITFGKYTATQLSNWSRIRKTPWSKADALAALDDREIAIFFDLYLPIIKGKANDSV